MKAVLIFGVIFVISCSHTPNHRAHKSIAPLSEPSSPYSVSLDQLVQKQQTGRAHLKLKANGTLSSAQLADLKSSLRSRQPASASAPTKSTVRVDAMKSLRSRNYSELQSASLDQVVRAASRLGAAEFKSISEDINGSFRCVPSQVSLALAAVGERNFPDKSAVELVTDLYEKAYSCDKDEYRARAAYRLGLFAINNGNCKKSLPYWNAVSESESARFLFSRAEYWRNHCNPIEDGSRQAALDFYYSYPLSFHSLQEVQDIKEDLRPVVMARSTPHALVRTAHNKHLNTLTEQIEAAIESGKPALAREYLNWITDSQLQEAEPHYLLYLGYLSHLAEDGLSAFQILAKAFSQYPQLKTATTLRFFYPKWYYDEVRAEARRNGLDPLLLLSLIRQESAFNRAAISRVGARGLMQLMPATARSLDRSLGKQQLLDPEKNIRAGSRYLARLMKRYDGNVVLALAAYNAGFGAVDKWVTRYPTKNQLLFKDMIPYRETREYVASILRNHYWYQMLEQQDNAPRIILGSNFNPTINTEIKDFDGTDHRLHIELATSETESNVLQR